METRHGSQEPSKAATGVVLITGANSGLGLEFAKQYASAKWIVYAVHRHAKTPEALAEACARSPSIHAERMDVSKSREVTRLARKLQDVPIDVLINNAGIAYDKNLSLDTQSFGRLDYDLGEMIFAVNVRGALMVTEAFMSHLKASKQKKVICMSSATASLTQSLPGAGGIFYRASKAALNRAMISVAAAVKEHGVSVVLIHPGAVLTERNLEFSKRHARTHGRYPNMIETRFSVSQMIQTISRLSITDSGRFLNYDGTTAAW